MMGAHRSCTSGGPPAGDAALPPTSHPFLFIVGLSLPLNSGDNWRAPELARIIARLIGFLFNGPQFLLEQATAAEETKAFEMRRHLDQFLFNIVTTYTNATARELFAGSHPACRLPAQVLASIAHAIPNAAQLLNYPLCFTRAL